MPGVWGGHAGVIYFVPGKSMQHLDVAFICRLWESHLVVSLTGVRELYPSAGPVDGAHS